MSDAAARRREPARRLPRRRTGTVEAVRGVSFTLGRERLGIVGEIRLGQIASPAARCSASCRRPREVTAERLRFDGIDLLAAGAASCCAAARRAAWR